MPKKIRLFSAQRHSPLPRLSDGRFVGSDGYEYFIAGGGGGEPVTELGDGQKTDRGCRTATGYDTQGTVVGNARVCSYWSDNYTTLGVTVKLITPQNGNGFIYKAYSCDVEPNKIPIVFNQCRSNYTDPGQTSSEEKFYDVNPTHHTGGFQFLKRGRKIAP